MLTIFQNIVKIFTEIILLIIYSLCLHCYLLYIKFEGDVKEKEMKNYFDYGFHINNTVYVFLALNLLKFIANIILSLYRFCYLRN